jgi:hypothetical protein
VVQVAIAVVQPEKQRTDVRARAVLVPPEPGDDAFGRALVLDLQHRPLARLIGRIESLCDDTVESGTLESVEPVGSERDVRGRRREMDGRLRAGQH